MRDLALPTASHQCRKADAPKCPGRGRPCTRCSCSRHLSAVFPPSADAIHSERRLRVGNVTRPLEPGTGIAVWDDQKPEPNSGAADRAGQRSAIHAMTMGNLATIRNQVGAIAFARGRRGFTILELIVGIAIIAVLAVLAYPSYGNHRDRIRVAQAVIDIKDMDVKLQHYFVDYREFPKDLSGIGKGGFRDPWGNLYYYTNLDDAKGKGASRKNKNLTPINSDFDLYSSGKDGATVSPLTAKTSRDDIVRANNGRFVGLASDYEP